MQSEKFCRVHVNVMTAGAISLLITIFNLFSHFSFFNINCAYLCTFIVISIYIVSTNLLEEHVYNEVGNKSIVIKKYLLVSPVCIIEGIESRCLTYC